jgi:hypothetical protein
MLDDLDILPQGLSSIAAYIDEIVVVDGAYRWMAALLSGAGRDPTGSMAEVCRALDPFKPKLRVLNGIWADELK